MLNRKTLARNMLVLLAAIAIGALWSFENEARAEEIHVTHWGELLTSAPYAVALKRGYFKDNGVDITGIVASKGGGTTVRNLLAGGIPFGEVAAAAAIDAYQANLPIKLVGSAINTVGDIMWVVMPDSPIKTLEDLKGRKMGISNAGGTTDMVSTLILAKKGIPLDAVERPVVGGFAAGLAVLENGSIDAAVMVEPLWSARADKYRMIVRASDVLPPIAQSVLVASTDLIENEPEKLRGILAARNRAVKEIYEDTDKAAEEILEYYPSLDIEVAKKAMRTLAEIKYWSADPVDRQALKEMIAGLSVVGRATGDENIDTMVDDSFVAKSGG